MMATPWRILSDEPDLTGAIGELLEIVSGQFGTPEYLRHCIVPASAEDGEITDDDRERAALIVRAVNAHEAMVEALKHCLGILCEAGNLNNYRNLSDAELGKAWVAVAKEAAAALALVEPNPAAARGDRS